MLSFGVTNYFVFALPFFFVLSSYLLFLSISNSWMFGNIVPMEYVSKKRE